MMSSKQGNSEFKPVEIGRLLSDVFKNRKWRSKLELHRVFEFWDRALGKDLASVARPSLIRGTVLWVKVKDSVWMQQLHLQKILLLEKINEHLTEEQITDIHFQLDSSLEVREEPEEKKTQTVLPDKRQEQEFDRLISTLENDDLKASLKSLWVKMHTHKD